ncbi:MAG: hypothetical protein HW400_826 [Candidatus Levybacteria bacterium]|nr:hypothetical protein [Candidatus Levybacteria bacterium]
MRELIIPPDPKLNISREFLKVFNQLRKSPEPGRIFELAQEPTKGELKFIVDNSNMEIAIIRLNHDSWRMLGGGTRREVLIPQKFEKASNIIAHSHLSLPNDSGETPALTDCFNLKAKEFVFHSDGITYFTGINKHPITGKSWTPKDFNEIKELDHLFVTTQLYRVNPDLKKDATNIPIELAYGDFLRKLGVVIIQKTWQELSDKNPLSQFPFNSVA